MAALDEVWPKLDRLEPMGKELLIEGLVAAISHDGQVSVAEAELLRTVCASLHCPLPPMLRRCRSSRLVPSGRRASAPAHAADQVGGALGDHHRRRIGVAADQLGHHRGVDHAQALARRARAAAGRPPRRVVVAPMRQVPTGW